MMTHLQQQLLVRADLESQEAKPPFLIPLFKRVFTLVNKIEYYQEEVFIIGTDQGYYYLIVYHRGIVREFSRFDSLAQAKIHFDETFSPSCWKKDVRPHWIELLNNPYLNFFIGPVLKKMIEGG